MEPQIVPWIKDLGFPIAAFLLMYRMVVISMAEQTKAVNAMTVALTELRDAMKSVRKCPLAEDYLEPARVEKRAS